MDIVDLSLGLNTTRAERELRRLDALGNQLFSKRGFKINVSTTGLPLSRITGDFDNFRSSLDAATARVAAFTATTGIVYGLADAFRRLFTESITLEKQLATIQSILRASSSEMGKLSDNLLQVANSTSQSFTVAVEAATEFSRQGLTLNKTIEATTAALALSKIAGLDAASAVQSLTSTMNTFAQEGLTYQKVLDTIVSLDNNFAASAAGIADGLKRVGSVASEAGVELKEVAALITVVQQVSARGEAVISNGLKTIFTRLGRSDIQERLQEIGIATKDATGSFRPFIDVLSDLANAQDKLSDSQRALVNETVAGGYQINTLQSVLKTLRGEYSLFDRAVEVAGNSAGDTAARLRVLNDTASSSLQVLQNNLSRTFATIGSKTVLPLLKDFTTTVNGILESFNSSKFESSFGNIDSRSIGEKFASGFIDGLSSFLGSSGLSILTVVVSRLFGKVASDLGKGIFNLTVSNKGVQVNAELQRTVNAAILRGNQALVQRLATTDSLITKNQILNQLLERQSQIGNLNLTSVLASRGLKNANIKTKARGFIPAILKEKKDILSGIGGASRSAEPLIREVDLGKGREKVVVNSDELLVKNYLNSGKDAIFNQDMIRDAGGIEALKKMGQVKRFASGSVYDQLKNVYSQEEELFRKNNLNGNFATTQRGKELRQALARALSGTFDQSSIKNILSNSPLKQNKPLIEDLSATGAQKPTKTFTPSSGISNIRGGVTDNQFETNKKQDQSGLRKYKELDRAREARLKIEIEQIRLKKSELRLLEEAEKNQKKLAKKDALGRIGLGASIVAPFLASGIGSAFGVSSKDNSGEGRALRGVESASSGLAIAAAFGFNPISIVAGGLVTTLSFLQKEAQATIPSFEDLKRSADKIIAVNQAQINSVQNVIQGQNILAELNNKGASIQERAKARDSIVTSASQIGDKRIASLLLSGNSSKQSQDAIDRFQLGLQQSSRAQESLLFARKNVEEAQSKDNSIFNLFAGKRAGQTNLNSDDFDAFLAPLIDSVDAVALSSNSGATRLNQLNKGIISGADFFKILGEEFGLLESTARGASNEFQNLINSFSADSIRALEKYTVAQFKYKQSLLELSKTYTEAEAVSVNFKKAFDLSIKNLANKFDFENFSDSIRSRSATSINKQIFEAQREAGQISEQEFVQNTSASSKVESQIDFVDKSNKAFQEAVNPLVEQLSKTNLDPSKQGKIIGKISSLFSGKTSFTDLENTVKQVLGASVESTDILSTVSKTSEQLGKDIAKLVLEMETSNNEIITLEKLQLARLNRGPNIEEVLSGKTGEARSKLLNKTVDLDLSKKISDLTKKIAVVGATSKKGVELTNQVNSLKFRQQSLRQQDLEARKFLVPSSGVKLSEDGKKQQAEILAADFYKTNSELLRQALDEINAISTKKFGSKKFSEEIINQLTSSLSLGNANKVISSLQSTSSSTSNPEIKNLLNNIFSSGVLSGFQPNEIPKTKEVNVPKSVDFTTEIERFKNSLNNFLPTESFTKNEKEFKNISSAQSKTKGAADAVAISLGQLADLDKVVEKNRQIIEKNSESFRNRLGDDLVQKIKTGSLTRGQFSSLSEFKRNTISSSDIKLPEKTRADLEDTVNQQNNELRFLLEEQKNIEKNAADSLKELNEKISTLIEVQKGGGSPQAGIQSKVEQAISLAVDVRGVDNKLVTDIKSALTSVVDARIKEVIKDTFNVAAITKPSTSVA